MNFSRLEIMDKPVPFVSLWILENKGLRWRLSCC